MGLINIIDYGHEKIEPEYSFLESIWETTKVKYNFEEKYKVSKFVRVYCIAHTHGIEPHLHHDDGDFTMIYYPRLDWKPEEIVELLFGIIKKMK